MTPKSSYISTHGQLEIDVTNDIISIPSLPCFCCVITQVSYCHTPTWNNNHHGELVKLNASASSAIWRYTSHHIIIIIIIIIIIVAVVVVIVAL